MTCIVESKMVLTIASFCLSCARVHAISPNQPVRGDASSREAFSVMELPPDAVERMIREDHAEPVRKREPVVLEQIEALAEAGDDWRTFACQHLLKVDDADRLLLEIRLQSDQDRVTSASLAHQLGIEIHGQNVPILFDAWVPVSALGRLRAVPEVFTVGGARAVRAHPLPVRKPQPSPVVPEPDLLN